jgi:hypothetical protein
VNWRSAGAAAGRSPDQSTEVGQLSRYTGRSLGQRPDGGFRRPLPLASRTRVTEYSLKETIPGHRSGTAHGRSRSLAARCLNGRSRLQCSRRRPYPGNASRCGRRRHRGSSVRACRAQLSYMLSAASATTIGCQRPSASITAIGSAIRGERGPTGPRDHGSHKRADRLGAGNDARMAQAPP